MLTWKNILTNSLTHDLTKTVLLIVLLIVAYTLLSRMVARASNLSMDIKLRWTTNLRNVMLLIGLISVIVLWSSEIQAVALSMAALVMAFVIASKEVLMCLSGSFLRTASNSFTLGDHVEIGSFRGQVVDINFLSTSIMEMGPGGAVYQFTGHIVTLPNSQLLTTPVVRLNGLGDYTVHTLAIPIAYQSDITTYENLLLTIAQETCAPYLDAARAYMENLERRNLYDMPSVKSRISILPIDEKHYKLLLRIAIPAKERQRIEQAILHRFMQAMYEMNRDNVT